MPWIIAGPAIAGLMALLFPVILKHRNEARETETTINAMQLHLALLDFDGKYGSFPSNETAGDDPALAGLTGPRVLEQLEASGCVKDLDRLLARGDTPNAMWYYFPGVSASSNSARPILIFPAIDDNVMVLRIDGSTKAESASSLSRMDLSGAVAIPAVERRR